MLRGCWGEVAGHESVGLRVLMRVSLKIWCISMTAAVSVNKGCYWMLLDGA